jgi:hypothetical protein
MTQLARPTQDVSTGLWTPKPLYAQLNEAVADDSTLVSSAGDPQGDTFVVQLRPLAWPKPGGTTRLTVRLRQSGGGGTMLVTVSLWQGSTLIAVRVFTPTANFADYVIDLTAAEVAAISDYSILRVQVTASKPVVSCCPQGISAVLYATFTNGTGTCTCLNGLSAPLVWQPANGFWESGQVAVCGKTAALLLRLQCAGSNFFVSSSLCQLRASPQPADSCSPFQITWTGVIAGLCCSGTIDLTVTE